MRRLLLLLIVVIVILPLYSFSIQDSRILIGTGNDKLSLGISKNDDDGLSFDFSFRLQTGFLRLDVVSYSYTDRIQKTRFDRLHAECMLFHDWKLTDRISLEAGASIGFNYIGNLNLETIQNINHRLKGINQVHFRYPEKDSFALYADLPVSVSLGFSDQFKAVMAVSPNLNGWEPGIDAEVALHYSLAEINLQYLRGEWRVGAAADFGIVSLGYIKDLQSSFGYGFVQLDAMGLFREKTWRRSDVLMAIGLEETDTFEFIVNRIVVPVHDRFSIVAVNKYTSGFPGSKRIPQDTRVQRNHVQFAAGCSFIIHDLRWARPFAELDAGLAVWQTDFIYTDGRERVAEEALLTPFVQTMAGIDILPQDLLVFDSSSLTVEFAVGIAYYFDSDRITSYVRKDYYHRSDYNFNAWNTFIHLGINIGFDSP